MSKSFFGFDRGMFVRSSFALSKEWKDLPKSLQKKYIGSAFKKWSKENKLPKVFKGHTPKGQKLPGLTNNPGGKSKVKKVSSRRASATRKTSLRKKWGLYVPGKMRASVGSKAFLRRDKKQWQFVVGCMRSKTKFGWYALMVNDGTKKRQQKSGKGVGFIGGGERGKNVFKPKAVSAVKSLGTKDLKRYCMEALRNAQKVMKTAKKKGKTR